MPDTACLEIWLMTALLYILWNVSSCNFQQNICFTNNKGLGNVRMRKTRTMYSYYKMLLKMSINKHLSIKQIELWFSNTLLSKIIDSLLNFLWIFLMYQIMHRLCWWFLTKSKATWEVSIYIVWERVLQLVQFERNALW